MNEFCETVEKLNGLVLDLSREGKIVKFNPQFRYERDPDSPPTLGLGEPTSFDLGVTIAEPLVKKTERSGLPSDDQKINHDGPTLPSLRYIPLFDGD
jgi:hypothetical protein